VLEAIAKGMPWAPRMIAALTLMTSSAVDTKGPPEVRGTKHKSGDKRRRAP
jgi:hypothetical protein